MSNPVAMIATRVPAVKIFFIPKSVILVSTSIRGGRLPPNDQNQNRKPTPAIKPITAWMDFVMTTLLSGGS
jgi:hypothetical protein